MDLTTRLQDCYMQMQSGDLAGAETKYHSIAREYPDNGDVLHLGALIAHRAGLQGVAMERVDAAIKIIPNHHEYHNTRGNICNALQDFPETIKSYKKSLELKPDYKTAAQNLGRCFIKNNDPKQALQIYERALKYHAGNEILQIGRVIALKELLQNEAALKALDAMPNGDNYPFVRGQILMQMQEFDRAIVANKQALANDKTSADAFQNICQILWMQGKWDTALADMDDLLADSGHNEGVYIRAARMLAKSDNMGMAYEMLSRAEKRFGKRPDILGAKARFLIEEEKMQAAYECAFEGLSMAPGDLSLMAEFADSALASGRANEAMHAAINALKIMPNNQFWIAIRATAMRALGQDHTYFTNPDKFVIPFEIEPEGYSNLENYNKDLKAALDEMHKLNEHPLDQSLRFGTQTLSDLRFCEHPILKTHFKALDKPIREYMKMLGHDATHPFLRRNTFNYHITGSWSVKLRKAGFHVSHVHPEGWISSAYYVEVPDEVNDEKNKPGWIHFGKPPLSIKNTKGELLDYEKIIKPKSGILVLFPSYLWHGTNPLRQNAPRMTLPIDVVPI